MVRYTNRVTGVKVSVADRRPMGDEWVPDGARPSTVCDVCGFAAKTSAGLGTHMRRHEG